jgi:hypothetical protein
VRDSVVPWHCRAQCLLFSLKLPWPSDHVCNGGTWKISVRPGVPGEVSRRKMFQVFFKNNRRHFRRKIRFRYYQQRVYIKLSLLVIYILFYQQSTFIKLSLLVIYILLYQQTDIFYQQRFYIKYRHWPFIFIGSTTYLYLIIIASQFFNNTFIIKHYC